MNYKCISKTNYTSMDGIVYKPGQIISGSEMKNLAYEDKAMFNKDNEESEEYALEREHFNDFADF